MFHAKTVGNINTLFVFPNFPKIVLFMRFIGKTFIAAQDTVTVWCTRVACCVTKAKIIDLQYIIVIDFHCNNGCRKVPQCYVISKLSTLLLKNYATPQC